MDLTCFYCSITLDCPNITTLHEDVVLKCPNCHITGNPKEVRAVFPGFDPITQSQAIHSGFTKYDSGKPRMTLVPTILRKAVATIMTFGADKYGVDNWKECKPEELWRYKDALERHWCAYLDGEWLDPESNNPHLWHAATNMGMLIWHEAKNRVTSSDS